MAIIASQIKRIKTDEKKRLINKSIKSSVRTSIKKAKHGIETNSTDTPNLISRAYQLLDRSSKKNVFHKNTVANYKRKLMNFYNKNTKTENSKEL